MARRDFIQTTAGVVVAGAAAPLAGPLAAQKPAGPFAAPSNGLVRIGYVGLCGMGLARVRNLLRAPGCRITAVCDINASPAVDAPDFTRGAWRHHSPAPLVRA